MKQEQEIFINMEEVELSSRGRQCSSNLGKNRGGGAIFVGPQDRIIVTADHTLSEWIV